MNDELEALIEAVKTRGSVNVDGYTIRVEINSSHWLEFEATPIVNGVSIECTETQNGNWMAESRTSKYHYGDSFESLLTLFN